MSPATARWFASMMASNRRMTIQDLLNDLPHWGQNLKSGLTENPHCGQKLADDALPASMPSTIPLAADLATVSTAPLVSSAM